MHDACARGDRVQVVAPWQRDGESLAEVLGRNGYRVLLYPDLPALADHIGDETGVVVLTQEALRHGTQALEKSLAAQPAWSDIPFIVLHSAAHRGDGRASPLPPAVINRIELERPLGATSLLSAVAAAMRSRGRQFEIKDRMEELADSRKALADSEAELRRITDSLPVLIAFIDQDYRYRFANEAYRAWFGIDPADMLGKTVRQVFGEAEWQARSEAIRRALAGTPSQVEYAWPLRDGRRREAEFRYLPRRHEDGHIDGVHLFATDITERKEALQAVSQAATRLEQTVAERTAELRAEMQARLDSEAALRQAQKMEAVGQLTGGIAHDFNNLLTAVIGSTDLLVRRLAGDPRSQGLAQNALDAARRGAKLTSQLLTFSRGQRIELGPVDLHALCDGMGELLAQSLGPRIRLQVSVEPEARWVQSDANQLELALLNLAVNARDAMGGEGDFTIRARRLASGEGAPLAGAWAEISVTDTGPGMEPEVARRAIEPFFTTKEVGAGTGLGLSQVYGLVRQSGGALDIDSLPGHGATIRMRLPLAEAPEAPAATPERPPEPRPVERDLVMVVDDDAAVRRFLVESLSAAGYEVVEAPGPDAALELLARHRPRLLVTDQLMPGLTGAELAARAVTLQPGLRVLVVTGNLESAAVGSIPGASVLHKPFDAPRLAAAVAAALARDMD